MITFTLLNKLFDRRQYELLLIEIINNKFATEYPNFGFIWSDDEDPPFYYESKTKITELQFYELSSFCKKEVNKEMLQLLFLERTQIEAAIQNLYITNKDGHIINTTMGIVLNKMNFYHDNYKNAEWLNDKLFILEELEVIKIIKDKFGKEY